MNFFKIFAALLKNEITATIVIKMTSNGKMTVITNFNTANGSVCESLAPFTLKGTPEELDEGYLEEIKAPIETVKGLVSNYAAFQKAAEEAKKAMANSVKGSSSTKQDIEQKIEEEKKRKAAEERRRAAEEKARQDNFNKALEDAKTANAHGNYYTAEALLNLASTLTDNKKTKAELAKQIKAIAPNKDGFLCIDDAEKAAKVLEDFKNNMVKPEVEAEAPNNDNPADGSAKPESEVSGSKDTPENDVNEPEPESDNNENTEGDTDSDD